MARRSPRRATRKGRYRPDSSSRVTEVRNSVITSARLVVWLAVSGMLEYRSGKQED